MVDNLLLNKSTDFAVKILDLCDHLKNGGVITNQLARSGTSIGANIHEAQYANSRADFVAKLEVALKECSETEYWLELLSKTGKIDDDLFRSLKSGAGTIRRILIKSCTTAKGNSDK